MAVPSPARNERRRFAVGFTAGVLAAAVLGLLGIAAGARLGLFPVETEGGPSRVERALSRSAIDGALARRAPRTASPLPRADSVLFSGLRIYRNNCAGCHGDARTGPSDFGRAFYPPAPQFNEHPPRRPEWASFYLVRNGIRYTGMTAWRSIMPDDSIWRVVRFVSSLESLPPAVEERWRHGPPKPVTGQR
jgi:mono/diheme cytochrome c family protein